VKLLPLVHPLSRLLSGGVVEKIFLTAKHAKKVLFEQPRGVKILTNLFTEEINLPKYISPVLIRN